MRTGHSLAIMSAVEGQGNVTSLGSENPPSADSSHGFGTFAGVSVPLRSVANGQVVLVPVVSVSPQGGR